jgi:Flp pilus assembly protein TadB
MMPAPATAWITVRVPADALSEVVKGLSTLGTVTASQTDRRDVTTETLDLRARVSALETSVARLTDLMKQSTSTADLIAAESALSERQSELDSLRQQLTWTESQVAMSTLTVSLVEPSPAVTADPAGFGDGVAAGWNGLVATLNALVVAIGFLLPWLGVAAVIAALVVLIVRVRRGRHRRRNASAGPVENP